MRTRMQSHYLHCGVSKKTKIFGLIKNIFKNEGIHGFYKGFGASLIGDKYIKIINDII